MKLTPVCLEVPLQCYCTAIALHCNVVGLLCIYMGPVSRVLQTSLRTGWHRETPRLEGGRAETLFPFGRTGDEKPVRKNP